MYYNLYENEGIQSIINKYRLPVINAFQMLCREHLRPSNEIHDNAYILLNLSRW